MRAAASPAHPGFRLFPFFGGLLAECHRLWKGKGSTSGARLPQRLALPPLACFWRRSWETRLFLQPGGEAVPRLRCLSPQGLLPILHLRPASPCCAQRPFFLPAPRFYPGLSLRKYTSALQVPWGGGGCAWPPAAAEGPPAGPSPPREAGGLKPSPEGAVEGEPTVAVRAAQPLPAPPPLAAPAARAGGEAGSGAWWRRELPEGGRHRDTESPLGSSSESAAAVTWREGGRVGAEGWPLGLALRSHPSWGGSVGWACEPLSPALETSRNRA